MAFSRKLVQSQLNVSRISSRVLTSCCVFPSCMVAEKASFNRKQMPEKAQKASLDPGDDGISRRYLHHLRVATDPEHRFLPQGEKMLDNIREMDIPGQRVRYDGLWRRPTQVSPQGRLTEADVRKILRISQLEMVKSRLRKIEKGRVSHTEFLQICVNECLNVDQGLEFAKKLDESGSVIIIGNTVFLRPEQLVKAIQGLVHLPSADKCCADSRTKELQKMEKQKASIDKNAESRVRNELWCGLGYLIIQTAVFMRLTFWDLTWDVMEPICFYVASFDAIGGYAFFLRTSKEPSFEGFFQSRFRTKQKRLMQVQNFDVERYNELKKGFFSY
ncbi:calcium uniporter protein 2, mitochondrial-like [Primulina eburnea]|uniref:calcium uniporter protein 2, mitochondrial-like n=1 Tax=Primulina eburnea TaxID=1245227 RepID=UPI003C6C0879